jgi:hypothetical protein
MPERFEANTFSPDETKLMKEAFAVAWPKAQFIAQEESLTRQLLASAIIDMVNVGSIDRDQIAIAAVAAVEAAARIRK